MIDDQDISDIYSKPHLLEGILGYCHQLNGLEESFTVKEYLEIMCNLLCVKEEFMD